MTPEAKESLRNSHSPEKACVEKPDQVKGQPPYAVYAYIPKTNTHQEISKLIAAP